MAFLVGSLERIFRLVLFHNGPEIFKRLLCPVCNSLTNPKGEISSLGSLFNEVTNLGKTPLPLNVPDGLRGFGLFGGRVVLEAFWTHNKSVKFAVPGNNRQIRAETSDVVFLVSHEYLKPNAVTLVDEKISFFQAKLEKKNAVFKIKPRQWHLMRYWPDFSYKGKQFALEVCRKVPDICSFYLLLFKKNVYNYRFVAENSAHWNFETNSVCLSTPFMEEKIPKLKNLNRNDIVTNNDISLRLAQKDSDGFFDIMWDLLLTHLVAHDLPASMLMTTMFQDEPKRSNPGPSKDPNTRPTIGIRVRVQLKVESSSK